MDSLPLIESDVQCEWVTLGRVHTWCREGHASMARVAVELSKGTLNGHLVMRLPMCTTVRCDWQGEDLSCKATGRDCVKILIWGELIQNQLSAHDAHGDFSICIYTFTITLCFGGTSAVFFTCFNYHVLQWCKVRS